MTSAVEKRIERRRHDLDNHRAPLLAEFPYVLSNLTAAAQYVQDIFSTNSIVKTYRYGIAASEIFRGSRRGSALRARSAPTAPGTAVAFPPNSGFGGRIRL